MDIQSKIKDSQAFLLYFYSNSCAPCASLRPKVEAMLKKDFGNIEYLFLNAAEHPELTASYQVFASPTILVFFEGKENFRFNQYVSLDEMHRKIKRIYDLIF